MQLAISHPWDLTAAEAIALQSRLAARAITETTFEPARVRTVAGIDVSVRGGQAQAAVVVLSFPELEPLDLALSGAPAGFPYVPGLLTFREGPTVLAAFEKLRLWPDLLIFDGQGIAHPRRFGLAAHLGVLLDRPSIGCAKSRLVGQHQEPGEDAGEWTPLLDHGETIGAVLRTRARVKPVFVSIGHRIDLPTAIEFVLRCTRGFRLPETTRYAHKAAGGAQLPLSFGRPLEESATASAASAEADA